MWKIILKPEEKERSQTGRKLEGENRRVTRSSRNSGDNLKTEVSFRAQKGLRIFAKMMPEDRGVLNKEEVNIVREYKAMHEHNFPSSWLRGGYRR